MQAMPQNARRRTGHARIHWSTAKGVSSSGGGRPTLINEPQGRPPKLT